MIDAFEGSVIGLLKCERTKAIFLKSLGTADFGRKPRRCGLEQPKRALPSCDMTFELFRR